CRAALSVLPRRRSSDLEVNSRPLICMACKARKRSACLRFVEEVVDGGGGAGASEPAVDLFAFTASEDHHTRLVADCQPAPLEDRSEEHTSELQSRENLV